MEKCAVKECQNKADPRWFVYDEEGNAYQSCDGCGGNEYAENELDQDKREPCKTCGGEGYIEYGPSCSRPASDCCGGCFTQEACPDCGDPDANEPDWDAIAEARAEARADEALNAEVDWESPY